ncbi:unnamed protein product [Pieris macdunnoughi]|uniref:Uncharacterized protein n=1 Tax=Pieris macdunnoughi TaxID=345717 RepID=A0A821QTZ0_9NEOP|nr:unnamed protein product [Pieris macdunnoughi]
MEDISRNKSSEPSVRYMGWKIMREPTSQRKAKGSSGSERAGPTIGAGTVELPPRGVNSMSMLSEFSLHTVASGEPLAY